MVDPGSLVTPETRQVIGNSSRLPVNPDPLGPFFNPGDAVFLRLGVGGSAQNQSLKFLHGL